MTKEEGNKLIAGYMGAKIVNGYHGSDYAEWRDEDGLLIESVRLDNLKYDSSWDALMPVVIKIGEYASLQPVRYQSYNDTAKYSLNIWLISIEEIEPVRQAVVEFIQWLNLNQSPK